MSAGGFRDPPLGDRTARAGSADPMAAWQRAEGSKLMWDTSYHEVGDRTLVSAGATLAAHTCLPHSTTGRCLARFHSRAFCEAFAQ